MPLKLFATALVALLTVLTSAAPSFASTPIPSCHGHDAAGAATARAAGLKHYRQSRREGASDAEMTTALGFFDAACAAGDETVLELRAYALAGVERYVDAAETLDAFLAAHPLDSLPKETQERIAAQAPEILARVASLSIDSSPTGAQVTVNHRLVGTTPIVHLRLEPGRYDIAVIPTTGRSEQRSIDLVVGEHRESFRFDAEPTPSSGATPDTTAPVPPPPDTSRPAYRGWVIGTGVTAIGLIALGVGSAVWANERSNTYNEANGAAAPGKSGCSSTLSQYYAARDLEIIGFVAGGLATVAAGTLFYLDRRHRAPQPAATGVANVACGIAGKGVRCQLSF